MKVTYKGLTVREGDSITIRAQAISVTGTVVTVEHNGPDGWYIQLKYANVPGNFSYWKQGIDGGRITHVNSVPVEELQNPKPCPVIVDLGSGGDPERWKPNSIKLDYNYCDVDCSVIDTYEDIPIEERETTVIGYNMRTEKLPFHDNSVDAVYATHSLRYMWDDSIELHIILNELLRVMKQGAMFTVVDQCELMDILEGDYYSADYDNIEYFLNKALSIPCIHGKFEVDFAGSSGNEYCWILRAHRFYYPEEGGNK